MDEMRPAWIKPGILVMQNYPEQAVAGTVQHVYHRGRWLADVVWHYPDGDEPSDGQCVGRLVQVTPEQVAEARAIPVEQDGHLGAIRRSVVTARHGQYWVACGCNPQKCYFLGLPQPGRPRAMAWLATEDEARALFAHHALQEGPVLTPAR
jgi:hypothetical protein